MSRQRSLETIRQAEFVTIGELVRLTAARYSTLKFYTEEGLLPFEQAEEKLTRRYARVSSIQRLEEIKELRAKGMTVLQLKEHYGVIPTEKQEDTYIEMAEETESETIEDKMKVLCPAK